MDCRFVDPALGCSPSDTMLIFVMVRSLVAINQGPVNSSAEQGWCTRLRLGGEISKLPAYSSSFLPLGPGFVLVTFIPSSERRTASRKGTCDGYWNAMIVEGTFNALDAFTSRGLFIADRRNPNDDPINMIPCGYMITGSPWDYNSPRDWIVGLSIRPWAVAHLIPC